MSHILIKQLLDDKVTLWVFIIILTLTIANISYELLLGGLYTRELSSIWGLLLFTIIISVTFVVGKFVITCFVNPMIVSISKHSTMTKIFGKAINIVYYVLLGILVIISFQLLSTSQYSVDLFLAIAVISFGGAAVAMARLGLKLCSWYRSNRNSIILLYAFTFLLVAVGIGTIIAVNGKLIFADMGGKLVDPMVKSTTSNLSPGIQKGDYSKQLHLFNIISLPLRVAYVLTWIVSVVLLRNYSRKIGRKRFWILVTIPLILYIATALLFTLSSATTGSALLGVGYLTIIRIAYVLTTTMSGIFFAVIFFTVSAAMKDAKQIDVQNYLKCSAHGTMIIVASLTIPLNSVLYPPFVLVSWAFMGIGAFLLSIGFHSLAISVSQDIKLRKSMKNLIISESKLFDSMAIAQMQSELQGRVSKIFKKQELEMEKQTEIKSSLTEEDMKSYLRDVIQEVTSRK